MTDLTETLRLHSLWLSGDSDGIRANLRSANLRSANLSSANLSSANLRNANLRSANLRNAEMLCAGDGVYVKTMQIERWNVAYTNDILQIGCQRHAIEKWRKWSTPAGLVWVGQMDDNAEEWAMKHLHLIIAMIDASPVVAS